MSKQYKITVLIYMSVLATFSMSVNLIYGNFMGGFPVFSGRSNIIAILTTVFIHLIIFIANYFIILKKYERKDRILFSLSTFIMYRGFMPLLNY